MQQIYWQILKYLDQGEINKAGQIIAKNNLSEIDKKIFSVMINNWEYKSSARRDLERIVEDTQNPWAYLILSDFYLENNSHKANQRLIAKFLLEYESFNFVSAIGGSVAGKLLKINEEKLFLIQGVPLKVLESIMLNIDEENSDNLIEKKNSDNEVEKELGLFIKGNTFYLLGKAKRAIGSVEKALDCFLKAEKIFNSLRLNYYTSLCLLERSFCKLTETSQDELISLASIALTKLEQVGRSQEAALATARLNQLIAEKNDVVDDSYYQVGDYHFISTQMRYIRKRLTTIANNEHGVMILGERGTGKEGIAKAIHLLSNRKDKPFIKVNLNSLSKDLFKSQLFGYEKGAFTGADRRTLGLLDQAQGGVFFMDEIGELSEDHQVTLLDVIYYKKFKRVGGTEEIPIDIKFIAATNQNLENLTEKEQELRKTSYKGVDLQETKVFRSDLLDRFVWKINVPRLEERREEILPLISFFLNRHSKDKNVFSLTKPAECYLLHKNYPGNVRTLENDIVKAISNATNAKTTVITKELLDTGEDKVFNYFVFRENIAYSELMDSYRYSLFSEGLDYFNSNTQKLADSLQLPLKTLYNNLKKLSVGIKKENRY